MTSFMLMAFLPLSLPFFLFFFLNIHFLQMQKQQETTSTTATNAMATMAHDGTVQTKTQRKLMFLYSLTTLHYTIFWSHVLFASNRPKFKLLFKENLTLQYHIHCMEKRSQDILLTFSFSAPEKKENPYRFLKTRLLNLRWTIPLLNFPHLSK